MFERETGRAEAEVVAQLDRSFGPRLLDAGALPGGGWFLATEWIDGEPLGSEHVRRAPAPQASAAIRVAHDVAQGLVELHEAGFRHGDVKPANILVPKAGGEGPAVLVDLGLSSRWSEPARGGTLEYASPELRARPESAGPESDVFALGVVLRELLSVCVEPAADVARWVEAMLAPAPGARPSAAWIVERSRRLLTSGTTPESAEQARTLRRARVKRAYLALRARELAAGGRAPADGSLGSAGAWLREAVESLRKLGGGVGAGAPPLGPLSVVGRARWVVALVGPAASSWPADELGDDARLADRMLALAETMPPDAWTFDDLRSASRAPDAPRAPWSDAGADPIERVAALVAAVERPRPDAAALVAAEDRIAEGTAPETLVLRTADALARAGDVGRAFAALAEASGDAAAWRRAELARRRGDRDAARASALPLVDGDEAEPRWRARAVLARLAWDAGDARGASSWIAGARGAAAAEVGALIAYRRGAVDEARSQLREAMSATWDGLARARLEGTLGLVEHAAGRAADSARAFARAVDLAVQSGALIEEATYLTGLAAAATDDGDVALALESATRAALLWDRFGRRGEAARAWLSRASALGTVGATHAADEAAEEALARAEASGDVTAAAYACWAVVETRAPGDARARSFAGRAYETLARLGADGPSASDRARAVARLLVWAHDRVDPAEVTRVEGGVSDLDGPARWDWWGARAVAALGTHVARLDEGADIVAALLALLEVPAPVGARGPALLAAARLATERGDGDAARRFEIKRRELATALARRTPPELRAALASVPWTSLGADVEGAGALAPIQLEQLAAIVRALGTRDRLRPLLLQVLDTMILWSGVERGLLLLRAEDGRLVPRAARNLARRDLAGDQLELSRSLAQKAIETGEPVVATDAFSTLGEAHASVHALRLRSVLAVPLIARGETLGVVYLDDRVRRGAFGARELAWVRLVASQAAMAIADARDQVLLKRAVRKAERAERVVAELLREKELELEATRAELCVARGGTDAATRFPYDAIAGRSEAVTAMLRLVDRVTTSDVPVLLTGESGTGKELIARAIHANGSRGRRAFVSENCAAVPESLLESTLFGHVRGAFTGASSTRAGLFDVADGGTLFLDEIGEMPLAMQAKLLRVLQDGEVRAVGGERTRRVDVRIVAATHRDLGAMVQKRTFREDLFYRLAVFPVAVPPLRDRSDDIPVLVAHFLEKHAPGRTIKVTKAAMARLVGHAWPGNVRQLENEIRRAVVLADDRIDVGDLTPELTRGGPEAARAAGLDLRARVDALEAELVREALEKTRGNQTRAAEILGLSRFGLQKMMRRLNVRAGGEN